MCSVQKNSPTTAGDSADRRLAVFLDSRGVERQRGFGLSKPNHVSFEQLRPAAARSAGINEKTASVQVPNKIGNGEI